MQTHTNRRSTCKQYRQLRTRCHGNAGNQQHVLHNGNTPTAAPPAGRTCIWALTALGKERPGTNSSVQTQTQTHPTHHAAPAVKEAAGHQALLPQVPYQPSTCSHLTR